MGTRRGILTGLMLTTALTVGAGSGVALAQDMGIDCHEPRRAADGRLVYDPKFEYRRLCEADRAYALAVSDVLSGVQDRITGALRALPPPLLEDFVRHLESGARPDEWRPDAADLALFDTLPSNDPRGWLPGTRRVWGDGVFDGEYADWFNANALRVRACRTGVGQRSVQLVVWMDADALRDRWSPEAVQRAAAAWYGRDQAREVAALDAPGVTAGTAASPTVRTSDGREIGLEACFGTVPGGPWSTGQPSLAMADWVSWTTEREHRRQACGEGLVGYQNAERRLLRQIWLDPTSDSDAAVAVHGGRILPPDSEEAWGVTRDRCRPPRVVDVARLEECAEMATLGDRQVQGYVTRIYRFTEARHPDDPTRTVQVPVNADGQPTPSGEVQTPQPGARGTFCDSTDFPEPDGPTVTDLPIPQCRQVHGSAYPQGHRRGLIREVDFPDDWPMEDFTVRWEEDECYVRESRNATATRSLRCPSGYTGTFRERRTVVEQRTVPSPEWGKEAGAWAVASTGKWVTVQNTCQRRYSSNSYGGREPDPWSVDIDGDGRGDFRNHYEASKHGWDRRDMKTVSDHCSDCGGRTRFSGGKRIDPSPYKSNNKGNGGGSDSGSGGGGGGCFLTTAVTERRGEADDGPTLTLLREFRDGWLASQPFGPAVIEEYYRIAPRIVEAIPADHPEWDRIAAEVDRMYGSLVRFPEKRASVYVAYRSMVIRLIRDWLPDEPSAVTNQKENST